MAQFSFEINCFFGSVLFYNIQKEYLNSINRKNDLRKRAASFFTITFTIISVILTITFTDMNKEFSISKITLIIISSVLLVISLVLFLIIYSPTSQQTYSPINVLDDLRNIEDQPNNKKLVKYYENNDEFEYIGSELSLAFVAERYSEIVEWYNKKTSLFMKLFITMAVLLICSLTLLIISMVLR